MNEGAETDSCCDVVRCSSFSPVEAETASSYTEDRAGDDSSDQPEDVVLTLQILAILTV